MYQDSRGYYYQSKRIGRRVVKEYYGNNSYAQLLARTDSMLQPAEAEERATARRQLESEQAAIDAATAPLLAFDEAVTALVSATLEAAGYRQHKRGEWRKQRETKSSGASN
jgi:alpha-L-fucosidase